MNGEARGFLVSRDGRTRGLLWGTIHIGYGGNTVLPGPVRAAFTHARDLHVETAIDRMSESNVELLRQMQHAQDRYDPTALDRLDPATRLVLSRVTLPDGSAPRSSLRTLGRLVSAAALGSAGVLPEGDIMDVQLIGFARALGMEVGSLESIDSILPLVADDPNSDAAAAELREAVRRQDGVRRFAVWVGDAYAHGQVGDIAAAIVGWRAEPGDVERADVSRATLFTRRNAAWLPVLERSFAEDGFHFVAFGAGHLIGSDGIVALLRLRGWTVTPCLADRCPG